MKILNSLKRKLFEGVLIEERAGKGKEPGLDTVFDFMKENSLSTDKKDVIGFFSYLRSNNIEKPTVDSWYSFKDQSH